MKRVSSVALTCILLVFCTPEARSEDNANPALERMTRLSNALKSFRYPNGGRDKITLWRQSTPSTGSFSVTIGDSATSLMMAFGAFEDDCEPMDRTAVAILSDSGRTIRFVDATAKDLKREQLELKRGQLVILMAPQSDE